MEPFNYQNFKKLISDTQDKLMKIEYLMFYRGLIKANLGLLLLISLSSLWKEGNYYFHLNILNKCLILLIPTIPGLLNVLNFRNFLNKLILLKLKIFSTKSMKIEIKKCLKMSLLIIFYLSKHELNVVKILN